MQLSPNIQASLYMMLAMMGYSVNDMLIKTLSGSLPTIEIIGIRGVILSVFIALVIWQRGLLPRLGEALTLLVGLRTLMELCATLTFLTALMQLPLASTAAILQALPLAVTLGAALVFGERVGWRRWLAITVGLMGVLIIIRPGMQGFQPLSLLVVLAVMFAAARDLFTRGLPNSVPSLLVSAVSAWLIALAGVVTTTVTANWSPVSLHQWSVLTAAAFFLFIGYQCIVLTMRTGDVAYVVPFRYTSLLWAIMLGYFVFGDVPDTLTLIGAAIVISTGLFTLYREILARARINPQ
jgi:drug/metabolite transporter (DMT)-like permease